MEPGVALRCSPRASACSPTAAGRELNSEGIKTRNTAATCASGARAEEGTCPATTAGAPWQTAEAACASSAQEAHGPGAFHPRAPQSVHLTVSLTGWILSVASL